MLLSSGTGLNEQDWEQCLLRRKADESEARQFYAMKQAFGPMLSAIGDPDEEVATSSTEILMLLIGEPLIITSEGTVHVLERPP